MRYLFQVSIGPVQTFIASARRTRDLWFGSQLLSELAKAAAHKIQEQHGSMLIFPAPADADALRPDSELNVANKLVAIITDPRETGRAVQAAIDARREELWQAAQGTITGIFDNKRAQKQIDDMTECVWVALPLPNDDYATVRAALENLMAARKNTRDFAAVEWGAAVPKSSITGQLESVIPRNGLTAAQRRERYGAGPAEELSGVDLLKRKGIIGNAGNDRFFSTSHIAALPFLKRLEQIAEQKEAKKCWEAYLDELRKQQVRIERVPQHAATHPLIGYCDGAMLFEERLDDEVADPTQLADARQHLRAFLNEVDIGRPSPYYAILHADGDNMGAVIDHEAKQGYEQHRRLSQQLDLFASEARKIVEKHQGAAIYTGGDDVLALVPLHTLLGCAKALAADFADKMKAFKAKNQDGSNVSPKLSVGVAVVHHLMPLSDALDLARAAEKAAKDISGKNALAITVSKRSGGDYTVKGKWGAFDTRLEHFINQRANLSAGAAYELRDLHERMMLPDPTLTKAERDDSFWPMLRAEATRILRRKQGASGEKVDKDSAVKLVKKVGNEYTLADLANELIVARLLGDAQDLASEKGAAQ